MTQYKAFSVHKLASGGNGRMTESTKSKHRESVHFYDIDDPMLCWDVPGAITPKDLPRLIAATKEGMSGAPTPNELEKLIARVNAKSKETQTMSNNSKDSITTAKSALKDTLTKEPSITTAMNALNDTSTKEPSITTPKTAINDSFETAAMTNDSINDPCIHGTASTNDSFETVAMTNDSIDDPCIHGTALTKDLSETAAVTNDSIDDPCIHGTARTNDSSATNHSPFSSVEKDTSFPSSTTFTTATKVIAGKVSSTDCSGKQFYGWNKSPRKIRGGGMNLHKPSRRQFGNASEKANTARHGKKHGHNSNLPVQYRQHSFFPDQQLQPQPDSHDSTTQSGTRQHRPWTPGRQQQPGRNYDLTSRPSIPSEQIPCGGSDSTRPGTLTVQKKQQHSFDPVVAISSTGRPKKRNFLQEILSLEEPILHKKLRGVVEDTPASQQLNELAYESTTRSKETDVSTLRSEGIDESTSRSEETDALTTRNESPSPSEGVDASATRSEPPTSSELSSNLSEWSSFSSEKQQAFTAESAWLPRGIDVDSRCTINSSESTTSTTITESENTSFNEPIVIAFQCSIRNGSLVWNQPSNNCFLRSISGINDENIINSATRDLNFNSVFSLGSQSAIHLDILSEDGATSPTTKSSIVSNSHLPQSEEISDAAVSVSTRAEPNTVVESDAAETSGTKSNTIVESNAESTGAKSNTIVKSNVESTGAKSNTIVESNVESTGAKSSTGEESNAESSGAKSSTGVESYVESTGAKSTSNVDTCGVDLPLEPDEQGMIKTVFLLHQSSDQEEMPKCFPLDEPPDVEEALKAIKSSQKERIKSTTESPLFAMLQKEMDSLSLCDNPKQLTERVKGLKLKAMAKVVADGFADDEKTAQKFGFNFHPHFDINQEFGDSPDYSPPAEDQTRQYMEHLIQRLEQPEVRETAIQVLFAYNKTTAVVASWLSIMEHEALVFLGICLGFVHPYEPKDGHVALWTFTPLWLLKYYCIGQARRLGKLNRKEVFKIAKPYLVDLSTGDTLRVDGQNRRSGKLALTYSKSKGKVDIHVEEGTGTKPKHIGIHHLILLCLDPKYTQSKANLWACHRGYVTGTNSSSPKFQHPSTHCGEVKEVPEAPLEGACKTDGDHMLGYAYNSVWTVWRCNHQVNQWLHLIRQQCNSWCHPLCEHPYHEEQSKRSYPDFFSHLPKSLCQQVYGTDCYDIIVTSRTNSQQMCKDCNVSSKAPGNIRYCADCQAKHG